MRQLYLKLKSKYNNNHLNRNDIHQKRSHQTKIVHQNDTLFRSQLQ